MWIKSGQSENNICLKSVQLKSEVIKYWNIFPIVIVKPEAQNIGTNIGTKQFAEKVAVNKVAEGRSWYIKQ